MGVAHGDAEEGNLASSKLHAHEVAVRSHGDALRGKLRAAHVHRGGHGASVPDVQRNVLDPRQRIHVQLRLAAQSAVVEELRRAAHAVSAHLRLAAVAVEDAHHRVAAIAGNHQDQAVRTDAEAPRAQPPRKGGGVGNFVVNGVDDDEIVADAVHLDKAHGVSFVRNQARRVSSATSISAILSMSCTAMHSKRPW